LARDTVEAVGKARTEYGFASQFRQVLRYRTRMPGRSLS
jgi:hypothetical protein